MDTDGNNALDLAIDNGHEAVALAIIKGPRWERALRNTTDAAWGGSTTPLRKLIRKMPEVAEEVFNRCTVTNATKDGKIRPDSREYRVLFNYEFLEDFQDRETAAHRLARRLTRKEHSALAISADGEEQEDLSDSRSVKSSDDAEAGHVDMITKLRSRKGRRFTTSWGPEGFRKSRHSLSVMVASAQIDLLKHPLVTSLLDYKWRTYGRYVYFGNLFIYVVFLVFLTAFALTSPNPVSRTCRAVLSDSFGRNPDNLTDSQIENLDSETRRIKIEGSCAEVLNTATEVFLVLAAIVVIVSSGVRIIMELFQMIQLQLLPYFVNWVNWVEMTLFVCSIIFVFTFFTDCFCPTEWQWQLGAIAVFLGWIDLIIFTRKLTFTGIYVVMFIDIFYTFCRLFFLSFLLVVAFGLAFYMTFNDPDLMRQPFSTPARSLLKTMTMTTGEFEYDGIFRQAPGGIDPGTVREIPFPPVTYILWIVFIILMPILLTNLLVGLAVDDIKGILEAAVLKRLALKVELTLNIEELFPVHLRRFFIIGSQEIAPNRDFTLWEKFSYLAWGGERTDSSEKIVNALNPPQTPIEQVQGQTRSLLTEMDHMRQHVTQLTERNHKMEDMLTAIVKHHGIVLDDDCKPAAVTQGPLRSRTTPPPHGAERPRTPPPGGRARTPETKLTEI
ncbi:Transient receptor potential cation channel subfamily A member 1 homolog [Geodia barretti]|nr:Transient receptor potential cation channel subfamily A member 1 homolog [Geodia barretti]